MGWLGRWRRRLGLPAGLLGLPGQLDDVRVLTARLLVEQVRSHGPYEDLRDAEFKVFSQFGDDGILQYLLHHVDVRSDSFVEFGVEDYLESNTRFLLVHDNWRGLVIDGNRAHVDAIRASEMYARHELTAVHAFVDRDNIDGLIERAGFRGELGVLSIDIDGNDYWVWERITVVEPAIVVVEYNSVFGRDRAVTIPYDPRFDRVRAHYSHLYFGCSLKALCRLAERKEYAFVGSNSSGLNAYFVRQDRLGRVPVRTAEEGYVASRFRESRGPDGRLNFVTGADRRRLIEDMVVHDLERGVEVRIRDL